MSICEKCSKCCTLLMNGVNCAKGVRSLAVVLPLNLRLTDDNSLYQLRMHKHGVQLASDDKN